MFEVGMLVVVNAGINLYDIDSNARVIATRDVINNALKVGRVKAIDEDIVLLEGLTYESDEEVWFSQEWLSPYDQEYEVTCCHCGEKIKFSEAIVKRGKIYCESCYSSLPVCENCGEVHDELFDTIDGKLCISCIGDYSQHLYDYSTEWKHRRVNADDKTLLIGAEIEIDDGDRKEHTRKEITQVMGKSVVFENDGSLHNGIEIVTHPFSFDFWENKVDYISRMFDIAKENDWKSHDTRTCGLHIHVDKNDLQTSERTQDEVIDNILLITETFMNELVNFSRRHNTEYARFLRDIEECDQTIYMKYIRRNKDNGRSKYRAVNIDHKGTVEFRMFKGTLNIKSFMASIELVNNIVEIAKYCDIDGLTWNDIITYNEDKTHYIKEYNGVRGIVSDTCVHLLSEIEINKDKFCIDEFMKSRFGINTSSLSSVQLAFLTGILRAYNVKDDGKVVRCDAISYCKIKVRNHTLVKDARTNIQDGEDIIDLWQEQY